MNCSILFGASLLLATTATLALAAAPSTATLRVNPTPARGDALRNTPEGAAHDQFALVFGQGQSSPR